MGLEHGDSQLSCRTSYKMYCTSCFQTIIHIGNDVIISYGVYSARHGRNQVSQPIIVKDGAYIGMRASIISKNAGIPWGNGYWRRCNHWRKNRGRILCLSKSRCSPWCYGSWNSLQYYREIRDCNRRIKHRTFESGGAA